MMGETLELISTSVDDTLAIGRAIGAVLRPRDVVALVGELGSGKTHLVKGLAEGLGVADRGAVNSPTFVLVNEYEGRYRLYHLDAYRLSGAAEVAALGFEEMREAGVVVVEWADRARELMGEGALWVELRAAGENERRIRIQSNQQRLMPKALIADAGFPRPQHSDGAPLSEMQQLAEASEQAAADAWGEEDFDDWEDKKA